MSRQDDGRRTDPLQSVRETVDRWERILNDLLAERGAEEESNAVRSFFSDRTLDARKRLREFWGDNFHSVNLPTRTDVIRLGQRIAQVEEGVARIESQLRRIEQRLPGAQAVSPVRRTDGGARPRRTRKPPADVPTQATQREK